MPEVAGTNHCENYLEFLLDVRSPAAAIGALAVAEHRMKNTYLARGDEAVLTEVEERRVTALHMAQRDQIWQELLEPVFEHPEIVYTALRETIEKDCSGSCRDCPFKRADLSLKQ